MNGSAHKNIIRNSSFAIEDTQSSAFESKLTKMFWSILFIPKHLMASHANETYVNAVKRRATRVAKSPYYGVLMLG